MFFNLTVLIDHLLSDIYKPVNHNLIDTFKDNLSILHNNINNYCEHLDSCELEQPISLYYKEECEERFMLLGYSKDDQIIKDGIKYSINGICDIISNETIIEIKTSTSENCKNEWILQVLIYYMLFYLNCKHYFQKYKIIIILIGISYEIEFKIPNKKHFFFKLFNHILTEYKFIPQLIDKFNNYIKKQYIKKQSKSFYSRTYL